MSEAERIGLCEPTLGGNIRRYLDECIDTNFVSSVGPFVERFEKAFAAYVGSKHAVACASGTAALHVAMRLFDVGPGDEVFVPSLTFIASANPVIYEKATPVLVDSEPVTWNGDPRLVVEELDRRARVGAKMPKLVEAVHILGHPADLVPVVEACARYGVTLLEDAAEALGARYTAGPLAGKHVGTIGRVGCFSFNGNKIVTAGGGGMIVTDDEALARRAKHLTTQARLPGAEYRHDEVGYNYRLTNVAAAIGLSQLELLPQFLVDKKRIADRYDAALGGRAGVVLPARAAWAQPSHWLYSLEVPDRKALAARLGERRIESRPIWSPLHTFPMYESAPRLGTGRVAEAVHARGLSLPSSAHLTAAEQERVIDALLGGL